MVVCCDLNECVMVGKRPRECDSARAWCQCVHVSVCVLVARAVRAGCLVSACASAWLSARAVSVRGCGCVCVCVCVSVCAYAREMASLWVSVDT